MVWNKHFRYLYSSIADWLDKRYERLIQRMRVELVFRPFLRWLDKNAEDLFTGGLKQVNPHGPL